jgi:hypothetical protein
LTDTTLAEVFHRHVDDGRAAGTAGLVVRWDRETGWAHLGITGADAAVPRFAGFHQFAAGATEAVVAELAAAGCVTAPARLVDDGLMEIEAVLACPEVASHETR